MKILENYYKNIIKKDLTTKFLYTSPKQIPQLKKIVLNLRCLQNNKTKQNLASSTLALELITKNYISITKSKKAHIMLEIKKGQPVGCKIELKKSNMYDFLFKLTFEVIPLIKNFKPVLLKAKKTNNNFSFSIKDLSVFNNSEEYFYIFTNLSPLNITFITNIKTFKELKFFLNSFKIPTKNCIYNSNGRV